MATPEPADAPNHRPTSHEDLPTNEARAGLNQIAAGFGRNGPDAVPVVLGSQLVEGQSSFNAG